ncbi:General secretion pathway protein N [Vibrio nigripulchritudo SOn1]|uniref:Type II secretion system protein N n=1 Tax=Vibrio nigripulchritudo SOn1 TaxID=1238450 RepID=A0AAV2VQX3_9VIBR|nr:type II secretion system protein N [Vibrio nigripulchritudo]CCO47042.1 General secretion pathway protein N [Vibrio nigripulchritudo SOn1]
MKRFLGYVSVFVLVLIVSLAVHMPVSFVYQYAPKVRGLELGHLTGSVWRGQASNVAWQGQNFGQLSWNFQPSALVSGKAEFLVRFGRGSELQLHGKGAVGFGFGGLYGENIFASMPAENVLRFAQVPAPVDVQGQLELAIKDFQYGQPWCQSATGNLAWNGGKLGTPLGELVLGEVTSDIICEDNTLTAKGEQKHAQVTSAFDANLSPNQQYNVTAWFKPGAEFPPSMSSQLNWLGNPNNQGQYPFQYSGRL